MAIFLDVEARPRNVHGDDDDRDADGGRFWMPVAFPQPRPPQHARLHSEEEGDGAGLPDKVAELEAACNDEIGRASCRERVYVLV